MRSGHRRGGPVERDGRGGRRRLRQQLAAMRRSSESGHRRRPAGYRRPGNYDALDQPAARHWTRGRWHVERTAVRVLSIVLTIVLKVSQPGAVRNQSMGGQSYARRGGHQGVRNVPAGRPDSVRRTRTSHPGHDDRGARIQKSGNISTNDNDRTPQTRFFFNGGAKQFFFFLLKSPPSKNIKKTF